MKKRSELKLALLQVMKCMRNMRCPSAGVVVVIGYVSGNQCMVANDATVKAGLGLITGKKNLRARKLQLIINYQ